MTAPATWINSLTAAMGVPDELDDLAWLQAFTEAVSTKMGYDNIAKLTTMEHGDHLPLPLFDPTELAEHWLTTGGTAGCFPLARLFAAVATSRGINTVIRAAYQLEGDSGLAVAYGNKTADHVVCQMRIGSTNYVVDPAFVHHEPAKLTDGRHDAVGPVYSRIQVYAGAAGDILTVNHGDDATMRRYWLGRVIDDDEQRRAYELVGRLPRNCRLYIRHSNRSYQLSYTNGNLVRRTGFGSVVTKAPYPTDYEFIEWFGLSTDLAGQAAHLAMIQSHIREHPESACRPAPNSILV
jgi:hypothetical protein